MTSQAFYQSLNYVNHSREKRKHYSQLVIANPDYLVYLLDTIEAVKDPISCRAAWVLEFVCKSDLSLLFPHLDRFSALLPLVEQDAAIRPVAKICEYLCLSYYKVQLPLTRQVVQPTYKEQWVTAGFDWLITDQKVAVKAYTLTSLFYLGTDYDWVHPELLRIMDDNYASSSAAYKARCRHIFAAIKKYRANR